MITHHTRVSVFTTLFLALVVVGTCLPESVGAVCTPLGTTTPTVGLCKPGNGETGWTNAINDNWTLLDNRLVPPGAVMFYAAATPPAGWYACDGSAKNRTTDAALFAVIGTVYGAGDGSTTFNMPNAQSRNVIAAGQGSGLTLRNLAATGGEEAHALTIPEIPSHNHTISGAMPSAGVTFQGSGSGAGGGSPAPSIGFTGGTVPFNGHNVMDPFLVLTCIIKR
ncbi:MAG: tail fiber protein [Nitrospira sp.]